MYNTAFKWQLKSIKGKQFKYNLKFNDKMATLIKRLRLIGLQ